MNCTTNRSGAGRQVASFRGIWPKVLPRIVSRLSAAVLVVSASLPSGCAGAGMRDGREPPGGENRLANGDFETSSPGDRSVPDGWFLRTWSPPKDPNARAAYLARGGYAGAGVSIGADGPGADAAWTTVVTLKPNTLYRLAGRIRTEDVQGATGALLNIQNRQDVRTQAVRGTRAWQRVATTFRTDAERLTLEINCLFGGWGASTGRAWYDDIRIEELGSMDGITADIRIDAGGSAPLAYDRMIFGGFLEHFNKQVYGGIFDPGSPLADEDGFRRDAIAALRELGTPVVRWPGGCYVSGYHWRNGVGRTRETTDDLAWGVRDPHTFGTDEFIRLCRKVGWEPYICNNAGNGTQEEMREWVEYCNAASGPLAGMREANGNASPHAVRIWSIGNENWGSHEIGAKSPEVWPEYVARAAVEMKKADPGILLSAAALPDRQWTLPLLRVAGEHLDYVSIHQYALPNWAENHTPDYLSCIARSTEFERSIVNTIAILEEAGFRGRIKIAFDEWNLRGWHHPGFPRKQVSDYDSPETRAFVAARDKNLDESQYTMADALFSASFLNACLRHCEDVAMANIAPIVNTRGPLRIHPGGIVRRTTFHTLAMYARLLGSHVVPAEVTSEPLGEIPRIDALATTTPDTGAVRLVLINRHPSEEAVCRIALPGREPLEGEVPAVILAGDSPDAYNDIDRPERVKPEAGKATFTEGRVRVPPHALAILTLE